MRNSNSIPKHSHVQKKIKLLITPQNPVSNCSYRKCFFAVSPLEFFWIEVFYHLFVFTVNGVFFTVQKDISWARIGIVKERSRKSIVTPLQFWKQGIFVANNEILYFSGLGGAFIVGNSYLENREVVWRVICYYSKELKILYKETSRWKEEEFHTDAVSKEVVC